uniref:Uncharacterized protein n=1 Tax=Biomphalaria glabrata TaxID=6526 RepID=A0A2C9LM77_BIOGL
MSVNVVHTEDVSIKVFANIHLTPTLLFFGQRCINTVNSMNRGDLLDNDCDGWGDEENWNGLDDTDFKANDDRLDDLGIFFSQTDTVEAILSYSPSNVSEYRFKMIPIKYIPPNLGLIFKWTIETTTISATNLCPAKFTEWSPWHCTRDCSVSDMVKTRTCEDTVNPLRCEGSVIETKPSNCYAKLCPIDCPWNLFGDDCSKSCKQCVNICDRFNGSCIECRRGYDFPESGCQLDRTAYEDWTEWSCASNCSDTSYYRKRICKNQISGGISSTDCSYPVFDRKAGDCYLSGKCPINCKDFTWGLGCNGTCMKCQEPCDKFTGHCRACKAGYKGNRASICFKIST